MHSEQGIRIVDKVVRRDAKFCEALLSSLGIKNDTAEVLLSRQGLEELCDMSHLKCLEALWVNNNRLKSIQGLDNNVQIKDLYASSNVIATLDGSLRHLKYLRILSLNRNKLADLDKVLAAISHLSSLEELGVLSACEHCSSSDLSPPLLASPLFASPLFSSLLFPSMLLRPFRKPRRKRALLPRAHHLHLPLLACARPAHRDSERAGEREDALRRESLDQLELYAQKTAVEKSAAAEHCLALYPHKGDVPRDRAEEA
eukprot:385464-Hanusia_phi.AAC.1